MNLSSKKEQAKTSKKAYKKPEMKDVKLGTDVALLVGSCGEDEACASGN